MTGTILIVDDNPVNLKLLAARLEREYYDVVQASNGLSALEIVNSKNVDVILLDVMMPEMDGYEVCRRIKSDDSKKYIPVVMVTALDGLSDKVKALDLGADDFLTKPIDEVELIARVNSLVRSKHLFDELANRLESSQKLLDILENNNGVEDLNKTSKILVIEDRDVEYDNLYHNLTPEFRVEREIDPYKSINIAKKRDYDLVILSLSLNHCDGLRVGANFKSDESLRNLPILMIVDQDEKDKAIRGLDLGLNDYIKRPVEDTELHARIKTLIYQKKLSQELRNAVSSGLTMALSDPLTGLNNRRYLDSHLEKLFNVETPKGYNLTLMVLDVDHFKFVNDTYGHSVGDEVLIEISNRIKGVLRGADFVCRYGGEEFVVVLPSSNLENSLVVAERINEIIECAPFKITSDLAEEIPITISIGLTTKITTDKSYNELIERADMGLYEAKRNGRNMVEAIILEDDDMEEASSNDTEQNIDNSSNDYHSAIGQ